MSYLANVWIDGLTGEGFAELRNEHYGELEFGEWSASFPRRAFLGLEEGSLLAGTVDIH